MLTLKGQVQTGQLPEHGRGWVSPSWLCHRFCCPNWKPRSITGPSTQVPQPRRPASWGFTLAPGWARHPRGAMPDTPGLGDACMGTHSSRTATRPPLGSATTATGLYCSTATAPGQRGGHPTVLWRSKGHQGTWERAPCRSCCPAPARLPLSALRGSLSGRSPFITTCHPTIRHSGTAERSLRTQVQHFAGQPE